MVFFLILKNYQMKQFYKIVIMQLLILIVFFKIHLFLLKIIMKEI